jgi:uncharacterized protein (TIGR02217 family)
MRHWLAKAGDGQRRRWVKRFDPRYWTVDFPRPMMAAVTSVGADALVVDAEFLRRADLAGLIWESQDRWSHPLLALDTARDYRGVQLSFRVQISGDVVLLDGINGPVLTIEGRDAAGMARAWYVRLWNYADGSPSDARVNLDFDALDGGFVLPGEADRVWPGDIDRMFVSLVASGYDGTDAPLVEAVTARMTLSDIACDGPGSMIEAGDAFVPPHGMHIASGYDDSYNQTPERLLEGILALGYRGSLVHYLGMSHFPTLRWDGVAEAYLAAGAGTGTVCGPALAWHADFLARAVGLAFSPILSLSFELLDQNCPAPWAQRDANGARGLTGWVPPSALLSPAEPAAMAWLQNVAAVFVELSVAAGAAPRFQIGEPWWWVGPDKRPCLYDAATVALYLAETEQSAPPIFDVRQVSTAEQRDYLDWCGGLLGRATLALRDAALAVAAGTETLLLFYAPQVLDTEAPDLIRANMPQAWESPAYDVLQLEDYEFVTGGDFAGQRRAREVVTERLGYPLSAQHYLSGFVLEAATAEADWTAIADAAAAAQRRGVAETFIWAWPQVARDGFTAFSIGDGDDEEAAMAFHDVLFPLQLGFGAAGGPEFSTQVVVTASGHEQRNSQWSDARQYYDAGLGVRSEADLSQLISFFRARRGQAYGFRFNDPLDNSSALQGQPVSPTDQALGSGDGGQTRFALTKRYGEEVGQVRRISRPVADTVVVALDAVPVVDGWVLGDGGFVDFDVPPPPGVTVSAGFRFDVPVRFAVDRIDVSIAGWRAGELPSVPLVEVREA